MVFGQQNGQVWTRAAEEPTAEEKQLSINVQCEVQLLAGDHGASVVLIRRWHCAGLQDICGLKGPVPLLFILLWRGGRW